MMLFKKSLPVIFIILLSLFYNFPLKAAEQPTKADLESLTIPQIIERYQAPGQANLMIGKKILSINPKSAFKQFLTAGKYLKQGRDELVSMCAKQNQCFPEVIQENFQKLLDLAQADDQDAFSLLYRLGESKGIPVELSIRILDNLKPIYEKNPQLLLKTALEIASKDRRRGIHIIEILATKYNYSQAQLELGGCYEKGIVVQQNPKEALKYYLKAADQGEPRAQTIAALFFLKGKGTDQDFNRAFDLFKRAADQNYPNALFNVAVFYLEGYVEKRDFAQAISYFKRAAQYGSPHAYTALGELAENGINDQGVQEEPDLHKAFELYKQASVNDISANYNLAFFYDSGFEGEPDHEKADSLYKSVLESKDSKTYTHKALMYHYGIGTEQNLILAKKYYELTIANGNIRFQKYLDAVNAKILEESQETAAQKVANSVEIPAIPAQEAAQKAGAAQPTPRRQQQKPSAEQQAYAKIRSQEVDFIRMLNDKFLFADGSRIADVNFRDGIITITRESDGTVATMHIRLEDKKRMRKVKTLTYDPDRITVYFDQLKEAQKLSDGKYHSAIRHAFPEMVDVVCQLFGSKKAEEYQSEMRLTFAIPGTLLAGRTGKTFEGGFYYGYEDSKKPFVYHRFFHTK